MYRRALNVNIEKKTQMHQVSGPIYHNRPPEQANLWANRKLISD